MCSSLTCVTLTGVSQVDLPPRRLSNRAYPHHRLVEPAKCTNGRSNGKKITFSRDTAEPRRRGQTSFPFLTEQRYCGINEHHHHFIRALSPHLNALNGKAIKNIFQLLGKCWHTRDAWFSLNELLTNWNLNNWVVIKCNIYLMRVISKIMSPVSFYNEEHIKVNSFSEITIIDPAGNFYLHRKVTFTRSNSY